MKTIHHLKARWLLAAMLIAVAVGEYVAWAITKSMNWRFPSVAVAALCIGLVGAVVAWLYDGRE